MKESGWSRSARRWCVTTSELMSHASGTGTRASSRQPSRLKGSKNCAPCQRRLRPTSTRTSPRAMADPRPIVEVPDDDPYLWLEEIDGGRALAWVEAQNAATVARFSDARF